jgi:plasmid stabilization system protein ParE
MLFKYILHEQAQADYETSLQWYTKRNAEAALNFVAAVNNTLQLICEHPARWRSDYKNYHELALKNIHLLLLI